MVEVPNFSEQYPQGVESMEREYNPEFMKLALDLDALEKVTDGDRGLGELLDDMETKFFEYTEDSLKFNQFFLEHGASMDTPEALDEWERMGKDKTVLHDAMIDSVIILARNLDKAGKNSDMIKKFGNRDARNLFARTALATTFAELRKRKEEESHGNQ